ncbi:MAG TPA: sugar-binding domain-containing protein [Chthoniobacterales bacterium]|jgi:DNA-binding transcriptional regulator LsrR (DeoR family)
MPRRPLQRIQATTVARRYFVERQTKIQIAEDLGISRFKVARLIEEAVEAGLVRFEIDETGEIDAQLSDQLRRKYGLRNALILAGPDLPCSALFEPLGRAAASLLEEILTDGCVLGVAWGRTLAATAKAISRLPKISVVQVAGGLTTLEFPQNSADLVSRMAAAGDGTAYPIFLPMWVEDASLVKRLRTEPSVAQVLERYDRIDVLVSGIGSWNPPVSCLYDAFSKAWKRQVLAAGVRADLCATLIDDTGGVVPSPLDKVGLALNAKQIRRIPERVAIAGGLEKASAILAALKGKWITTLVTDAGVARRLLE